MGGGGSGGGSHLVQMLNYRRTRQPSNIGHDRGRINSYRLGHRSLQVYSTRVYYIEQSLSNEGGRVLGRINSWGRRS